MACLRSRSKRALVLFLGLWFFVSPTASAKVWEIPASEQMEHDAQEALILSQPGDTILLPEGRFAMSVELTVAKPHITLKGRGRDLTTLVYTESAEGPQAIMITADHAVVEDLAVIDHPGDGIKAVGVNGTTIRRVKIEWTKRAAQENGAYGLYPVMSSNVLLEDNLVIGASDAGVYVGQSKNIIVRRNRVEYNVAGIEIENSQRADVYENIATNNTGGVLVFNLPNLLVQGGRGTRVFKNEIFENNFVNFAPKGNSVALIPQGTGILVMSNDDIEIFENRIDRHNTTSIAIVSYHVTESAVQDPNYDAQPENIYIHHNKMRRAGMYPYIGGNMLGLITAVHSLPRRVPHIVYDGIGQADGKGGFAAADLKGNRRICLEQNDNDGGDEAIFGNMNFWKQKKWSPIPGDMERNYQDHTCALPRLATVTLAPVPAAPSRQPEADQERIADLCEAQGDGVNWKATSVDCPLLSHYRLFQDKTNPLSNWTEGAIPYEPTTPLFSDYASKSRVLYLPPGTAAEYDPEATFKLPKGTVIAKTFYFPVDLRQPQGPRRVIETRLLIHRK